MITVLVGQCCSGKDSIARELISKYGYKRVVSNTTRPMRAGEKEGVDYYFWNEVPFNRDVVSLKNIIQHRGLGITGLMLMILRKLLSQMRIILSLLI